MIIQERILGVRGWLIVCALSLCSHTVSADDNSLENRLKEFNAPEVEKARPIVRQISQNKPKKSSVAKTKKEVKVKKRKKYKRACYQSTAKTLLDRAESLQPAIRNASHRYGVSEALIISIITAESCFSRTARSPKNAQGLMQLIPATAKRFGVTNAYIPAQNIKGGTRYLKFLLKRFSGNLHLTIAAYNAGEGAVDRFSGIPPYRETRNYVKKVMSVYRRIQDYQGNSKVIKRASYLDPVSGKVVQNKDHFIKPDYQWVRKNKTGRVQKVYNASTTANKRSSCRDVSSVKLKSNSWLVEKNDGMKRYYSSRKPISLSTIAKKTGVSLSLLLRMNRNVSKYMIPANNKILVWQCAER